MFAVRSKVRGIGGGLMRFAGWYILWVALASSSLWLGGDIQRFRYMGF